MSRPIITLTTDFGASSPYVAQMKGVILSLNPEANIVDISHTIAPQDIRQGARVLADVTPTFPDETIHIAVVDPGVGSDRRIVYSRVGQQRFVAPDNGLLSLVTKHTPPSEIVVLTNEEYWLDEVSNTFHGRDIMAPVAAHLSCGLDPEKLGESTDNFTRITWPDVHVDAQEIVGSVVSFDTFGNLITDVTAEMLSEASESSDLMICCGTHVLREIVRTYGGGMPGTIIALIGSSGLLELSVVNSNAAQTLGVEVAEEVRITW